MVKKYQHNIQSEKINKIEFHPSGPFLELWEKKPNGKQSVYFYKLSEEVYQSLVNSSNPDEYYVNNIKDRYSRL